MGLLRLIGVAAGDVAAKGAPRSADAAAIRVRKRIHTLRLQHRHELILILLAGDLHFGVACPMR